MPPKKAEKKPVPFNKRKKIQGAISPSAIVAILKGGTFIWAGEGNGPCFELKLEHDTDKCEFPEDAATLMEKYWDD
jgi:hypothetical protein